MLQGAANKHRLPECENEWTQNGKIAIFGAGRWNVDSGVKNQKAHAKKTISHCRNSMMEGSSVHNEIPHHQKTRDQSSREIEKTQTGPIFCNPACLLKVIVVLPMRKVESSALTVGTFECKHHPAQQDATHIAMSENMFSKIAGLLGQCIPSLQISDYNSLLVHLKALHEKSLIQLLTRTWSSSNNKQSASTIWDLRTSHQARVKFHVSQACWQSSSINKKKKTDCTNAT